MNKADLSRFLGPTGWFVVVLVVVIAFIVLLQSIGFRFDPFNLAERRADRAEVAADTAAIDSSARLIEAAGADDGRRRTDQARIQIGSAEKVAATFAAQEPDSDDRRPLDPVRLARLRDADERLCAVRPAVCSGPGAPASPDHARTGPHTLPDTPAS